MHDALLARGHVKKLDPGFGAIFAQLLDHGIGQLVGEWLLALVGRHNVVYRGKGALRVEDLQIKVAQHAEGLRAGHLVNEVRADEQLRHAIGKLAHGVRFPDFVEQGFTHKRAKKNNL